MRRQAPPGPELSFSTTVLLVAAIGARFHTNRLEMNLLA